jgi:hypothetical protein
MSNQPSFDRIRIVNHYIPDDESYQSSDEDAGKTPSHLDPQQSSSSHTSLIRLHPSLDLNNRLGDTDSEGDDDGEGLVLSVPPNGTHKHTTV